MNNDMNNQDYDSKILKKTKNKKHTGKQKEIDYNKVELKLNDINFKKFRETAISELTLKLKERKIEDNNEEKAK